MIPADLEQVCAIASSLPNAPHWSMATYLDALSRGASPSRIALLAESTGNLITGFAVASLIPPQAELEIIAVAADHQRQSIARQLFSALVEKLKAMQIDMVLLEVRASNLPALALYCSQGFRQTARRPRYYADPVEDAILMLLPLEPPDQSSATSSHG
jgi:ribosomal-protein-alanine N-acetyltransferase